MRIRPLWGLHFDPSKSEYNRVVAFNRCLCVCKHRLHPKRYLLFLKRGSISIRNYVLNFVVFSMSHLLVNFAGFARAFLRSGATFRLFIQFTPIRVFRREIDRDIPRSATWHRPYSCLHPVVIDITLSVMRLCSSSTVLPFYCHFSNSSRTISVVGLFYDFYLEVVAWFGRHYSWWFSPLLFPFKSLWPSKTLLFIQEQL